jgi:hypothetical protein
MVENWNTAFSLSSGKFIGVYTDKMFLLPNILEKARKVIDATNCDLISWTDDSFVPKSFDNYFGSGTYISNKGSNARDMFESINGIKTLELKSKAFRNRSHSNRFDYAAGKICFGLYSRDLCLDIIEITGDLFLPITPDYTSMISALLYARNPIQLKSAGLVHINTDLSNGGKVAASVAYADSFLQTFSDYEEITKRFLVSSSKSPHNIVLHDYLRLHEILTREFMISRRRWLRNILDDEVFNNSSNRDESISEVKKCYRMLMGSWLGFCCYAIDRVFIAIRRQYYAFKGHLTWQLRIRLPKISRSFSRLPMVPWKVKDTLEISNKKVASIYDLI